MKGLSLPTPSMDAGTGEPRRPLVPVAAGDAVGPAAAGDAGGSGGAQEYASAERFWSRREARLRAADVRRAELREERAAGAHGAVVGRPFG